MEGNAQFKLIVTLLVVISVVVVGVIAVNVDLSKSFHSLERLAKTNTDFTQVDSDENGVIDEAERSQTILCSNGAQTVANCADLPGMAQPFTIEILIPENGTFTIPVGINNVEIELSGGGGSGGGADCRGSTYHGGGGGGAGYVHVTTAVQLGDAFSFSVGSGGVEGICGNNHGANGNTGEVSSLIFEGEEIIAGAGSRGLGGDPGTGGNGGENVVPEIFTILQNVSGETGTGGTSGDFGPGGAAGNGNDGNLLYEIVNLGSGGHGANKTGCNTCISARGGDGFLKITFFP